MLCICARVRGCCVCACPVSPVPLMGCVLALRTLPQSPPSPDQDQPRYRMGFRGDSQSVWLCGSLLNISFLFGFWSLGHVPATACQLVCVTGGWSRAVCRVPEFIVHAMRAHACVCEHVSMDAMCMRVHGCCAYACPWMLCMCACPWMLCVCVHVRACGRTPRLSTWPVGRRDAEIPQKWKTHPLLSRCVWLSLAGEPETRRPIKSVHTSVI